MGFPSGIGGEVPLNLLSDWLYRCPEEKQQVIAFLKEKPAPETRKVMEQ